MKYYILDLSPAELAGALPDRARLHGLHDLLEEPGRGGSRPRHRRLPHARRHGRARGGDTPLPAPAGARASAIASAAPCSRLPPPPWRATHDDRLAALTLLAAQTDFTEAGELMLFIDESQVDFLEDLMWAAGYLDTRQMAGAFQLLRSNDLIWSRVVQRLPAGRARRPDRPHGLERRRHPDAVPHAFGVPAPAVPAQRPGRGALPGRTGGRSPFTTFASPIFAVGTERDHVAPWRSVFKIHLLADTDVTFVLTSGGHNAGILSEPGHGIGISGSPRTGTASATSIPTAWLATNAPQRGLLVAGLGRVARRKIGERGWRRLHWAGRRQVRATRGRTGSLRLDEMKAGRG